MLKNHLRTGVAFCALMLPFGAVFADETQTVTNDAPVTVEPSPITVKGDLGIGATSSINATGAIGSVSISGVNAPFVTTANQGVATFVLSDLGNLVQGITNSGAVTTTGTITFDNATAGSPASFGMGASAGISGSGAVSSVSIQGISGGATGLDLGALPSFASIDQTTVNHGSIIVNGQIGPSANVSSVSLGLGASVSISATGAVSSVNASAIGGGAGTVSIPAVSLGATTQSSTNDASISNTGVFSVTDIGTGASANISAAGAVTSVGLLALGNATFTTTNLGPINQSATNFGNVANNGAATSVAGTLSGAGASASISAVGAAASMSATAIGNGITQSMSTVPTPFVGGIQVAGDPNSQTVVNSGAVTNTLDATWGGSAIAGITGAGATVSIAATGANAAISSAAIGSNGAVAPTFSNTVTQDVTNSGIITNTGVVNTTSAVTGAGASVSMSATGAVASISSTSIGSQDGNALTFQASTTQTVANTGDVHNNDSNTGLAQVGALSGNGSSASIGATGAVASISVMSIGGLGTFTGLTFNNTVKQDVTNEGLIKNYGSLTTGDLSGKGAAASISASGAVASISATSIDSGSGSTFANATFGGITQNATNTGVISHFDSTSTSNLTTGALSGPGASASISTTGAVASIGATAIGGAGDFQGPLLTGDVTQTSVNTGAVSMGSGTYIALLTTGDLSGAGASASIGAVGAMASISTNLISFGTDATGAPGPALTPPIFASLGTPALTQNAYNGAGVVTSGTISGGALSGAGSSASVSATGAVASISSSSINSGSITNASLGSAAAPTVNQNVINGVAANGTTISAAPVINAGKITTAALSGNGASASITATGAAANISVSSINDTTLASFTPLGSITQTVSNKQGSSVSNTGTIIVTGGLTGVGSSASISAVGASASMSFRSVK